MAKSVIAAPHLFNSSIKSGLPISALGIRILSASVQTSATYLPSSFAEYTLGIMSTINPASLRAVLVALPIAAILSSPILLISMLSFLSCPRKTFTPNGDVNKM